MWTLLEQVIYGLECHCYCHYFNMLWAAGNLEEKKYNTQNATDNNNSDLCSRYLVFYESYKLKVNIWTLKKTANKWRKENKRKKKRRTTIQLFLYIVCCVYMICRCFFPRHLHTHTHEYNRAHTHYTSKYRFAVMYLLLRLIVLNLAHKNSNVFAHQKVFSQHIKRQSTLYMEYVSAHMYSPELWQQSLFSLPLSHSILCITLKAK